MDTHDLAYRAVSLLVRRHARSDSFGDAEESHADFYSACKSRIVRAAFLCAAGQDKTESLDPVESEFAEAWERPISHDNNSVTENDAMPIVERIGHLYEELCELGVCRVEKTTVALAGTRTTKYPIIALDELETAQRTSTDALASLVRERTKMSAATIRKALREPLCKGIAERIDISCTDITGLAARVKPFGNLLRLDAWGDPIVYRKGAFAVVQSPRRRESGTHYTPGDLAADVLSGTLESFAHESRSGNLPCENAGGKRVEKPHEILALKLCDPAMGGGIFLVQACRLLAARLLASWTAEENAGRIISADGVSISPEHARDGKIVRISDDPHVREMQARRLVAKHCLYGVDLDPGAVELARLSLRFFTGEPLQSGETSDGDSKCLRCGDTLLGGLDGFDWKDAFPDVFSGERPGFDAVVGNPPFLGGRKMRGSLGDAALRRLKSEWPHASLNADLCAFFLLRASKIARKGGAIGLVAPNTIAQGDTARTGLLYLCRDATWSVRQAVASFAWPGKATVFASWIVLRQGDGHANAPCRLNGKTVTHISPVLDEGETWGETLPIPENVAINFQGSVLAGEGFLLSESDARRYINERYPNREAIFPYLGGSDVNSQPRFTPVRRVIDFRDHALERCRRDWPELLEHVERHVKPYRDRANRPAHRTYWWQHGDKRPALYARIREREFVFVLARHTKHLALARVPTGQVFQESLCILDLPDWTGFAAIQSTIHELWARRGSSTLGEGLRYTPSDYFDTFPFLHLRSEKMESAGKEYYAHRAATMDAFGAGLTEIYNRFHDPGEKNRRLTELRALRRRMDEAVCEAYGWDDLNLRHDFRDPAFFTVNAAVRFTIDESAGREILRRLVALNREHGSSRRGGKTVKKPAGC